MSISQCAKSQIGIMLIEVLYKTLVGILVRIECSTGKVRSDCCKPLVDIGTQLHLCFGSRFRHNCIRHIHRRFRFCLTDRSRSELLVKLCHDLIDRFFQSLLCAFLRKFRVHPFTLTLSCAVLVVKNNILFSVLHGSDILIRQTCFHYNDPPSI